MSKKRAALLGGGVLLLVAGIFYFTSHRKVITVPYADSAYILAPDSVSLDAPIPIRIPPGLSPKTGDAKTAIAFDPAIAGSWISSPKEQPSLLLYKPNKPLEKGKSYSIAFHAATGDVQKIFAADENPAIVTVLPGDKAEAPETSEISIVFNRPMVPLATLGSIDTSVLPLTLTPATKGHWEWRSTRLLQFIPETRLLRSTNYTVTVGQGLFSQDGLAVEGGEFHFRTRVLRYDASAFDHQGDTAHSQAISVRFNQPVDAEKTGKTISVTDSSGHDVPVVVEYGTRTIYDDKGKEKTYEDESVLAIYNQKDIHGRARIWDANMQYSITVAGAIPLEGNIPLADTQSTFITVPNYVAGYSAVSPRSDFVSAGLFDPSGTLSISFYEPIDKDKSSISAPGSTKIEYGTKCQRDSLGNLAYGSDGKCVEDKDQTVVKISFAANRFKAGDSIPVSITRLTTIAGVSLLSDPIQKNVSVYPVLAINSTWPTNGAIGASVRDFILCTNSPLHPPKDEDFYNKIRGTGPIGKWNWQAPHLVTAYDQSPKCAVGEFQNTINYSLIPERAYTLSLDLQDDFGQAISKQVSFTTEQLPDIYRKLDALQKQISVTSPEKTKLTFSSENLEYADVHVCRVSAETMLRYTTYNGVPSNHVSGGSLDCDQEITKRVDLPVRYWQKNYFQIDLKDLLGADLIGHYVVTVTNPGIREEIWKYDYDQRKTVMTLGSQIYDHTMLSVTRLAAQEKKIALYGEGNAPKDLQASLLGKTNGNLYWVMSYANLQPVSDAKVTVYKMNSDKNGNVSSFTPLDSAQTDAQGIARIAASSDQFAAIVRSGNDSTIVSGDKDKFAWGGGDAPASRTYLYTDRPIYRPGDTVYFKGINRIGYDGDYEVYQGRDANVTISNSSGQEVYNNNLPLSGFGTFTDHFVIDKKAPLGSYYVHGLDGYAYFDVADYAPAAFQVNMKSDKAEYVAGDTATVDLDSSYYFGVPVEKGKVEYSILAQNYYFDRYKDAYFNFGQDWYYDFSGGYGDTFISRGTGNLGLDGKFAIQQNLDFSKLFKDTAQNSSKIIVIRATVTNSTGQAISHEASFIVHRGNFYIGTNLDKRYFGTTEKANVLVKTVDTAGKPTAVRNLSGDVSKISWQSYKRQEVDGGFYYQSEEVKTSVEKFTVSTNSAGDASYAMSQKVPGEYLVTVSGKDSKGNTVQSSVDFYVSGAGVVEVRPTNNETLDLAVEKQDLRPSEQGRFVIKSPFPKGKALVSIERGSIFDYSILDIHEGLIPYSFTAKESYVPNVYASVLLLSPDPAVKYGQVQFNIDDSVKRVVIAVTPGKTVYLPGETVHLSIDTKTTTGTPVASEVSLAVADESVLALKGNPKKNPVSFFYGGFPLAVITSSNIKNVLQEAEIPTGTKGGGGLEAADLAKKKRGEFRDTALWQGVVVTNAQGHAEITFTLPDNITTWQAEAVAVTKDTKVGAGYAEFTAKKQLSIVPQKPRFVIPGDEFSIGAKVVNDTTQAQTVSVSIDAPTLTMLDRGARTLRLAPNDTGTVYFKAKAPETQDAGQHAMTLSAKSGNLEDTVSQTIPIVRNDTLEAVATSGVFSGNTAREYVYLPDFVRADKGGLTVRTQATIAPLMTDALKYLIAYPYGCSEQIASRIGAIALGKELGDTTTTVTLDGQTYSADDLVQIGLSRITSNQNPDGGFAYYPGLDSDFALTVHVLGSLMDLRHAGYQVSQTVVDAAARYTYTTMFKPEYTASKEWTIEGSYALSRVGGVWLSGPYAGALSSAVAGVANSYGYTPDTAGGATLARLALVLKVFGREDLGKGVVLLLENRLSVDARGAFVTSPSEDVGYYFYDTPVTRTALYARVRLAYQNEGPLFDQVLRFLRDAREADGSWGSTNETFTVLTAFRDYLAAHPAAQNQFTVDISLGDKKLGTHAFTGKNVFDGFTTFTPTSDIAKNSSVPLTFTKKENATAYYDALLTYALPVTQIASRDEGFSITREFYKRGDAKLTSPVTHAAPGDVLRGHLVITVPRYSRLVSVEDAVPAGTELIDFSLATSDQTLQENSRGPSLGTGDTPWFNLGAAIFSLGKNTPLPDELYGPLRAHDLLYPSATEVHDDRLFLFTQELAPGTYEYDYYVRALIPGTYQHLPATVKETYRPERFGRTAGSTFTVDSN